MICSYFLEAYDGAGVNDKKKSAMKTTNFFALCRSQPAPYGQVGVNVHRGGMLVFEETTQKKPLWHCF